MFRARMRVSPSQAEIDVRIELQHRHLHPFTDKVVIFGDTLTVTSKYLVTEKMLQDDDKRRRFTIPDFLFLNPILPVYIDGAPHMRQGVMKRDEEINELWIEHKIQPLRFSYQGKLSIIRRLDICNVIEEKRRRQLLRTGIKQDTQKLRKKLKNQKENLDAVEKLLEE